MTGLCRLYFRRTASALMEFVAIWLLLGSLLIDNKDDDKNKLNEKESCVEHNYLSNLSPLNFSNASRNSSEL